MQSAELNEVIKLFQSRPWPDNGPGIEHAAAQEFAGSGFQVARRASCEYRNRYRALLKGRIDLVVKRGSAVIGIEIDRRKPRRASLAKLRAFNGETIVIVRCGSGSEPLQRTGISRVISVQVRDERHSCCGRRDVHHPVEAPNSSGRTAEIT